MKPIRKCIRHAAKSQKHQGKAECHAALARIYLAASEEDEVSELRSAIEDYILPVVEVDFEEPS